MSLENILQNFLSLTQDAVAAGYRAKGDDTARLVYVNQGFVDVFGYTLEDVVNHPASILHDHDDWRDFVEKIAPQIAAGLPRFQSEARNRRADGSKFWASISLMYADYDEDGGRYSAAVYRDISELVQQRTNAEAAQTRLLDAINAYPDPFAIYQTDGTLSICNSAYAAVSSKDPQKIRPGMTYREIVSITLDDGLQLEPPEGRKAYFERTENEARAGIDVVDLELPGDRHHRVMRNVSESGNIIVQRVDITELVRQRRAAEEAQNRLLSAINAYPDPFVIYDRDMRLVTCNTAYRESMSTNPEAIRPGMHVGEVLNHAMDCGLIPEPPEGREAYVNGIIEDALKGKRAVDIEFAGDTHNRVLRSITENEDYVSISVDITELVRQRHTAEAAQKRLMSAINANPAPFCIYEPNGTLVAHNRAYALDFCKDPSRIRAGMKLDEVMRVALENRVFPDAIGREEEWLANMMANKRTVAPVEDIRLSGDRIHRTFRSHSDDGDLIIMRIDMTEQMRQRKALEEHAEQLERANDEITYKAFHDELTGLGNRRYLIDEFEKFRQKREADGGELAVLHIDLDRFKQINDTMGHAAGDHVLKEVAERIRGRVRPDDVVARIGGDEFVILIWQPELTERPLALAATLVNDMFRPCSFQDRECRFGASAGLACTPLAEVEDLLTSSDIALYKAKRGGRGQVGVFDAQDVEEMLRTKAMADDILRGIESSEFVPYYQPQIDASSGQVVGIEALARWEHPDKGIVPPSEFLSVAADLNVVSDIDSLIFEKAIAECSELFSGSDIIPSLSFNVSANRVIEGAYENIARHVSQYPGEIAFELLETIFLEEQDDVFLFQLDRLRDLGISIEVDDFGSGRASIVALQRIAPDRLKIDGRLVMPIAESTSAARLVKSIIEIGNALSIPVVAEGVETAEHARILAELGADRLQGYHFSKPLSGSRLRDYLFGSLRQACSN
ncbi:EAL domain-containing protein [Marimonas sp. MJW-29]|uniref:EAL domain-containing protein n=1 Tax=Sulfitobacter sediminis TaxID=3234186 RepID=A0ABV3RL16_9RHOB